MTGCQGSAPRVQPGAAVDPHLVALGQAPGGVGHAEYRRDPALAGEVDLLLEDGTVVIGDGYGAEIRMCAGSITISAPGDVWLKPGKNAQMWREGWLEASQGRRVAGESPFDGSIQTKRILLG